MLTPLRLEVGDVGVAREEPQQLVDDRLQVQLLGGDQREAPATRSKRIWWPNTASGCRSRSGRPCRRLRRARGAAGRDRLAWLLPLPRHDSRLRRWMADLRRIVHTAKGKSAFFARVPCCGGASFHASPHTYIRVRRRKAAMAINGHRNKPFGPGGGTRRLHQSPVRPHRRLVSGGGEIGSTRV